MIATIARTTLLEAVRGRLVVLVALGLAAGLALAAFLGQIAITESAAIRATIIGALARASAVFLLTAFVIASMVRERNDKGVELVLSHPLPRWAYIGGRYFGFLGVAVTLAASFSLPLLLTAPASNVALWGASLACELALLAAAAMFCAITLSQFVTAATAVGGFYLLGRSIDAIQALSASAAEGAGLADRLADGAVGALATLLPHLGRMTDAAWLSTAAPAGALANALGQSLLYVALLLAATLADFRRQNF